MVLEEPETGPRGEGRRKREKAEKTPRSGAANGFGAHSGRPFRPSSPPLHTPGRRRAGPGDDMSNNEIDADRDLIRRIAGGDKTAFQEFYRAYEKKIFFFIQRRLQDPHESADVFHEVMMDVWRKAGAFEGRSKVSSWVFQIAHNKSVDLLRKRGRREWDELDEETKDDSPTAADLLEVASDAAMVRGCVEKLKPPAREAIALAFFEGLKYREIAERLSCAEGTIKARIHRAMKDIEACVRRKSGAGRKETGK